MREILFRGQRIDNGEWVFGDLLTSKSGKKTLTYFVLPTHATAFDEYEEVKGESVGQFSGLLDKNGKKVFEGDLLQQWVDDWEAWDEEETCPKKKGKIDTATMERFPCYWLADETFGHEGDELESPEDWEIIGNIHDKTATT